MNSFPIIRVVTKLLIPYILLFGLYVQFHGDFGPGGGFQAGVILASALILYGLVFGLSAVEAVAPPDLVEKLVAIGLLLYAGTGVATMLMGGNFLDYDVLSFDSSKTVHAVELQNHEKPDASTSHGHSPDDSPDDSPDESDHQHESEQGSGQASAHKSDEEGHERHGHQDNGHQHGDHDDDGHDHDDGHHDDDHGHHEAHFWPTTQHLGIFLVELGVGITVTSVMTIIFYCFAGREQRF